MSIEIECCTPFYKDILYNIFIYCTITFIGSSYCFQQIKTLKGTVSLKKRRLSRYLYIFVAIISYIISIKINIFMFLSELN